jgi:hypothetical protein
MFKYDKNNEQYTNTNHILLNVRWCVVSGDTSAQSSILRKIQQLEGETPLFDDEIGNIFTPYIRTSTLYALMSRL